MPQGYLHGHIWFDCQIIIHHSDKAFHMHGQTILFFLFSGVASNTLALQLIGVGLLLMPLDHLERSLCCGALVKNY